MPDERDNYGILWFPSPAGKSPGAWRIRGTFLEERFTAGDSDTTHDTGPQTRVQCDWGDHERRWSHSCFAEGDTEVRPERLNAECDKRQYRDD